MNKVKQIEMTDEQETKFKQEGRKFLLKGYSTKEIFEELKTREGVATILVVTD